MHKDGVTIPKELRETLTQIISPSATTLADAGVLPVLHQLVTGFEQIPKLIDEVSLVASFFFVDSLICGKNRSCL